MINFDQICDLVSYLEDMTNGSPNKPDLELAADYLEMQGIAITDSYLAVAQEVIDDNF